MKRILIRGIVILSTSIFFILLSLCSCNMEESYKEFSIKNITDNLNEDYFASEIFVFAKIEDIVFIPEIKEINHGEYKIYISAYSKNGQEKVLIENVTIKEKENILLSYELNKEITFEENSDLIYEGWIDGGIFTKTDIEMVEGKEYNLLIEASVLKNDATISGNITYEIVITGYKSFVAPV